MGTRARVARALAGLMFVASAGVLLWPLALLTNRGLPDVLDLPLAVTMLWLALSHVAAAATGYRGCPEIGAIPSLLLRRRVVTTCSPWKRLDRRLSSGPKS
jgi:hypothetical protein